MEEPVWDLAALNLLIADKVEESLTLDYKSAESLGKDDLKKAEITKDVSAMANSAGGDIIYGLREHQEPDKRHIPEKLDPVNRQTYSREWLEQVINTIQPRIRGLIISPVPIDTTPPTAIFVVSVPQSTTAHQARNLKYYKRFNFQSVPMQDFEIRDVMNRGTTPSVEPEFSYKCTVDGQVHHYTLQVLVRNVGPVPVHNFKLEFKFPAFGDQITLQQISNYNHPYFGKIEHTKGPEPWYLITFRSIHVLFPLDVEDVGKHVGVAYVINDGVYAAINRLSETRPLALEWRLFADNMPPKSGTIPFSSLHEF